MIEKEWARDRDTRRRTTNVIICTSRVCVCVCVCLSLCACVWCVHCFIVIIAIIVNNERTMFSVTTTISVAHVCRRRLVSVAPGGQSWTSLTVRYVHARKLLFDFYVNSIFLPFAAVLTFFYQFLLRFF